MPGSATAYSAPRMECLNPILTQRAVPQLIEQMETELQTKKRGSLSCRIAVRCLVLTHAASPIVLRLRYARSGTDRDHAATRRERRGELSTYARCTRWPVLTLCMVQPRTRKTMRMSRTILVTSASCLCTRHALSRFNILHGPVCLHTNTMRCAVLTYCIVL